MSEQPKRVHVIVCIDESERSVTFTGGVVGLKKKIQQKFENWGVDDEMIVQVKSQDWEGEFADILQVCSK